MITIGVNVKIDELIVQMKTVKIMGVLVLGFTLCWTPYYVMSIWWWAHKSSAEQLDFRLQKLLWAFACLNNCLNPLLYRMVDRYRWRIALR